MIHIFQKCSWPHLHQIHTNFAFLNYKNLRGKPDHQLKQKKTKKAKNLASRTPPIKPVNQRFLF